MKKKILFSSFVILLVLSLMANVFFAIKYIESSKLNAGSVCGSSVIDRWNDSYLSGDMSKIAAEVKKLDGYDNDANCLFIIYYGERATPELYGKIKNKIQMGYGPSLLMRGVDNVYGMEIKTNNIIDGGDVEDVYVQE